MEIITTIYLLIESIEDIWKKQLSLWINVLFGAIGLLFFVDKEEGIISFALALIPGGVALLLSRCTRESIGYGDGIVLCVLGVLAGVDGLTCILIVAMGIAAVLALVLLVIFRKNGKYQMPFVPFLFIGWIFFLGKNYWGG